MNEPIGVSAAATLVGEVAAARLRKIIAAENGARVMYAMVDLPTQLSSAIGSAVRSLGAGGEVQVGIHPNCAAEGTPSYLLSSDVATRFRNNKESGVLLTLFAVPASEMELVRASLGDVERLNNDWLCEPRTMKLWASHGLPGRHDKSVDQLADVLKALLVSDVVQSAQRLAEFVISVRALMTGSEGLALPNAVNRALPTVRLPRDYLEAKGTPEAFASAAEVNLKRAREQCSQSLWLKSRNGEFRPARELRQQIATLVESGSLDSDAATALRALVDDQTLASGRWTSSQEAVAELPWRRVRPFFDETQKATKLKLGEETGRFFADQFPNILSPADKETLQEITSDAAQPSPEHRAFFAERRELLRNDAKLYKRWERFVFNRAIESSDLLTGLIELAEGTFKDSEDLDEPMLLVRLRGAEQKSFWTSEKNTDLCRYLRDRYRGFAKLLKDRVDLRFGHCWESDWEREVEAGNDKASKTAAEFQFEAFLVPASLIKDGREPAPAELRDFGKAQLTWRPGARSFAAAFSDDLRKILPTAHDGDAFLLTASVAQARHGRSGTLQSVSLKQIETLTDVRGENRGSLADPDTDDLRIDKGWPEALADLIGRGVIAQSDGRILGEAFQAFRRVYTDAIRAVTSGDGLASDALLSQAELYGELLQRLRQLAASEIGVRRLWEPLLRIGAAIVRGEQTSMIISPWHPLRLAELGVKAKQSAKIIGRIVASSSARTTGVEDYAKDRIEALRVSYYADVGLIPGEQTTIVIEASQFADYSLLTPPFAEDPTQLANQPAEEAVDQFSKITEQYLELRPHERANFSAAVLDVESDDLPVLMAKSLAKQIEDQADLRCDLVVTHQDPAKLRRIYERQNRRIGHELESSITGETARMFLSRLRVGIARPSTVTNADGSKAHDIVLLQDVIARKAKVSWSESSRPGVHPSLAENIPSDVSRRRPYTKGAVTSAVYLTSPIQSLASQAYLDVLHDAFQGKPSAATSHYLPTQEVNFHSQEVSQTLATAHSLANWVITYDRIADRRLLSSTKNLRILRYYSSPRSIHNVIVSTELSKRYIGERLRDDLAEIIPGSSADILSSLETAIHRRSASLSGGIVMRGAQWENHAKELIGVVVAQREVELLIKGLGQSTTAWFFLDDFRRWLDFQGEMADVLAVSLVNGATGPRIVMTVIEAKCVGEVGLSDMKAKSLRQLEATYTGLVNRFLDRGATVDPTIWQGRLADMLLEHIDPFERVGEIDFEEWIRGLRDGRFPIEISGHSIVLVHDRTLTASSDPLIPDLAKEKVKRRWLAQWTFGADVIARCMRSLEANEVVPHVRTPEQWPQEQHSKGRDDSPPAPRDPSKPHSPPDSIRSGISQADDPTQHEGEPAAPIGNTDGEQESTNLPQSATQGSRSQPLNGPNEQAAANVDDSGANQDSSKSQDRESSDEPVPSGWLPEIYRAVLSLNRRGSDEGGLAWLESQKAALRSAIQAEGMDAPILGGRLTPNTGLLFLDGRSITVGWLEKRQTQFMTRDRIEIVRITPMPGQIAVGIKRPKRVVLHLADAWLRRILETTAPVANMALVLGEKEDDGSIVYLPLGGSVASQERAAPHSIISGTTGSGKGILATSFILDACAFNSPRSMELRLIDPKKGVDYVWARKLPHLRGGIIDTKEEAVEAFRRLVRDMEDRYGQIAKAEVANIDQFNQKAAQSEKMPRILVFFDEVANWMQDDDFKETVEPLINEIATKSRAAGIHLFMIYQRADNQVMTMQLRTNLGNKLVLKLGDKGSSEIAMGERGAERLLGKGHLIAKLDSDEKLYLQVPYIGEDEVAKLAAVIAHAWETAPIETGRGEPAA